MTPLLGVCSGKELGEHGYEEKANLGPGWCAVVEALL
jgi:hypothetical protein